MRRTLCGIGLCVLVWGTLANSICSLDVAQAEQQAPLSQQTSESQPAVKPLVLSDGLIAMSSDLADGMQQVVVIDSKTRVMCVYHIDHKTGASTLKSARSLVADLQMDEFNTEKPLPREIRAILNKR